MWTPLHLSYLLSVVLAYVGACGLVAVHGNRLGRLGQAALGASLAGAVSGSAMMALEAVAFPILAARDPQLLALDGPLLTSPAAIGLGIFILGWPLGLALLGAAGARARVFPPPAGILLTVSSPAYLAMAGPFVPVLGVLSGVALGGAQAWWGWMMWRLVSRHGKAEYLGPATRSQGAGVIGPREVLRTRPFAHTRGRGRMGAGVRAAASVEDPAASRHEL
jgi:hypothetical protein